MPAWFLSLLAVAQIPPSGEGGRHLSPPSQEMEVGGELGPTIRTHAYQPGQAPALAPSRLVDSAEFAKNESIIEQLVTRRTQQLEEIEMLSRRLAELDHIARPNRPISIYPSPAGLTTVAEQREAIVSMATELQNANTLLAGLRDAIQRRLP